MALVPYLTCILLCYSSLFVHLLNYLLAQAKEINPIDLLLHNRKLIINLLI